MGRPGEKPIPPARVGLSVASSRARVSARTTAALASRPLSALTIAPEVVGPFGGPGWDATVALLRRCWEAGVSSFDLVAVGQFELSLAALARAFPQPDPSLTVLVPGSVVGPGPHGVPGKDTGGPRPGPPRPTVGTPSASGVRWLAGVSKLQEVDVASWDRLTEGSPARSGDRPDNLPGVLGRIVRCRTDSEFRRVADDPRAPLVSTELSLLRPRVADPRLDVPDPGGPRVVARDPLAGGELDGTAWERGTGRIGAPVQVRDLEARFARVLALGFLARRGQRTLAQASLGYLLGRPGVLTACLPLPSAARLEEVLGFATAPPLTPEEIDRLASLNGPAGAPSSEGRVK